MSWPEKVKPTFPATSDRRIKGLLLYFLRVFQALFSSAVMALVMSVVGSK